jgi:hypothetical protein
MLLLLIRHVTSKLNFTIFFKKITPLDVFIRIIFIVVGMRKLCCVYLGSNARNKQFIKIIEWIYWLAFYFRKRGENWLAQTLFALARSFNTMMMILRLITSFHLLSAQENVFGIFISSIFMRIKLSGCSPYFYSICTKPCFVLSSPAHYYS